MTVKNPPMQVSPNPVPRARRPWWHYALAILGGTVIVIVASGVIMFYALTSPTPMVIPKVIVTPEDQESLVIKWTQFQQAVSEGKPAAPCVISVKEMNIFFSMLPQYHDHILLSPAGDKLQAELSLPLDSWFPRIGRGRYLNAKDTFNARMGPDGLFSLDIVSAQVNGKTVPRWILRFLGRREYYRDISDPAGGSEFFSNLKSLEIRDGTVVLTPKNTP